ncbi:sensor histidine kinase [Streptomyces sp. NBC_01455]|uniref:sensor histidine kinase n=1 Tax=Streptomyces sp. NBC_01455 TaxID=2903874 RepID=UPI002E326702|nr:nitrate- and nitrite sensing domain-containing protein [Streptomyces sp. NBC_01455]
MKSRGSTIRRKLTALLLLPLLSLAALWSYAAYLSLGNALTLAHVNAIGTHLAHPLGHVVISLQDERRQALIRLVDLKAHGGQSSTTPESQDLDHTRIATDKAISDFMEQAHNENVRDDETAQVKKSVEAAERALGTLANLRRGVDSGKLPSSKVLSSYSMINAAISDAFRSMTILPDDKAQDLGLALFTLVLSGDFLSQEDALVSAAAADPRHRLGPEAYGAFVQDVGAERYLNALAMPGLPAAQRAPYEELATHGGTLQQVMAMEQQVIAAGPDAQRLPFSIEQWRAAYDKSWTTSNQLALGDIDVVFTLTSPPAHRALVELLTAGLLGLIALIASVAMSVKIARSLVMDLSRLRESARNLTEDRLRDVVGRLRRGENVDVTADMARPEFVNPEMARLGDAFYALQLTAVELAHEDIRLYQGIKDVFLNLARRSQGLVHRQLGVLDAMEKREHDPEVLSGLYRLDQLATRLRRYSEGLIIVSGAASGRIWRHAVPAVDVIRGAVAETEDYARVVVLPVPKIGIKGQAAADVIHLLAELIENAQHFSPADSEVRVNMGTGASGVIVEVDDRGLGMHDDAFEAANTQINSPQDISLLDSTHLGLVTVGRLARRHGINVTLRPSPYGGVSAVVLIPYTLIEDRDISAEHRATTTTDAYASARALEQRTPPSTSTPLPGTSPNPPGREHRAEHASPVWAEGQPVPSPQSTLDAWPAPHTVDVPRSDPAWRAPDNAPSTGQSDVIDGLPRRVRQANLAPQLRSDSYAPAGRAPMDWAGSPEAGQPPGESHAWQQPTSWFSAAGEGVASDSPANPVSEPRRPRPGDSSEEQTGRPPQVRTLMSALQHGAARGRLETSDTGGPLVPDLPAGDHYQGDGSFR